MTLEGWTLPLSPLNGLLFLEWRSRERDRLPWWRRRGGDRLSRRGDLVRRRGDLVRRRGDLERRGLLWRLERAGDLLPERERLTFRRGEGDLEIERGLLASREGERERERERASSMSSALPFGGDAKGERLRLLC